MLEMYECEIYGIVSGDRRSKGSKTLGLAGIVDFQPCCISRRGREIFCITPCVEWVYRSRATILEWSAVTRLLLFGIRILLVASGADYAVAE